MNTIKIAVTGGPSGGKTTLLAALKSELGQKCTLVPEAASILYRGGFPRHKDAHGQIHAQKAIYHTQRELEALFSIEAQSPLIVCDRGSLDSIAYWPHDEANFLAAIHSSKELEWARYDWVIHLDTASTDFYDTNNPIRTETHQEAAELNFKIKKAWEGHPRRVIISQSSDFLSKMTTSLAVIRAIVANHTIEDIHKITPKQGSCL